MKDFILRLKYRITKNIQTGQKLLDRQIMRDMEYYMPSLTGEFIEETKRKNAELEGTGKICVAPGTDYDHFLYEGVKYYDPETGNGPRPIDPERGIFRWRKGSHPVPNPENIPLHYTNPTAEPHWFEAAKRDHYDEWKKLVKNQVIIGTNGMEREVQINGRK